MMNKANRYSTLGVDRLKKRYAEVSMSLDLTHTVWTFIKVYFLRIGFLDGWPGFIIAILAIVMTHFIVMPNFMRKKN